MAQEDITTFKVGSDVHSCNVLYLVRLIVSVLHLWHQLQFLMVMRFLMSDY